jgi:hypothetical protein
MASPVYVYEQLKPYLNCDDVGGPGGGGGQNPRGQGTQGRPAGRGGGGRGGGSGGATRSGRGGAPPADGAAPAGVADGKSEKDGSPVVYIVCVVAVVLAGAAAFFKFGKRSKTGIEADAASMCAPPAARNSFSQLVFLSGWLAHPRVASGTP